MVLPALEEGLWEAGEGKLFPELRQDVVEQESSHNGYDEQNIAQTWLGRKRWAELLDQIHENYKYLKTQRYWKRTNVYKNTSKLQQLLLCLDW